MLDIRQIRKNPDEFKKRLGTRGVEPEKIDALLEKDKERRDLLVEAENLKTKTEEPNLEVRNALKDKVFQTTGNDNLK